MPTSGWEFEIHFNKLPSRFKSWKNFNKKMIKEQFPYSYFPYGKKCYVYQIGYKEYYVETMFLVQKLKEEQFNNKINKVLKDV